jgi:hypothetical protein
VSVIVTVNVTASPDVRLGNENPQSFPEVGAVGAPAVSLLVVLSCTVADRLCAGVAGAVPSVPYANQVVLPFTEAYQAVDPFGVLIPGPYQPPVSVSWSQGGRSTACS